MMKKIITLFVLVTLFSIVLVSAEQKPLPTDFSRNDEGLMKGYGDWANTVTNGYFWTLMLGFFCVVLFISASKYHSASAFGFAGFAALSGSTMLYTAGWMSWQITMMFILVGVGSAVAMIMQGKG